MSLKYWQLVFLFLGALILERGFRAAGLPIDFDAHSHVARTIFAATDLRAFAFSGWTPEWYGGFRYTELYGDFYYLSSGLLCAVGLDPFLVTKALVWLAQALGIVIWALAVPRSFASPTVALAAVAIAWCPERSWIVRVVGNYPGSFFLMFWGLYFVAVGRCREDSRSWPFAAAISLPLVMAAHSHFLYFVATLPIDLVFLWFALGGALSLRIAALSRLGLLVGIGSIPLCLDWLSARNTIAAFAWPSHYGLASGTELIASLFGARVPNAYVLLVPNHPSIWPALFAGAGVLLVIASPKHAHLRPWFAALVVAVLCVFPGGPRAMLFASLWLHLCAAISIGAIAGLLPQELVRRVPANLAFLLLVVLLAGLAPSLPKPHYAAADALQLYTKLPTRDPITASRTFDMTTAAFGADGKYGLSSLSPYITGRAIPFGAFPHGMPAVMLRNMMLAQVVVDAAVTQDPALRSLARDWCVINNVGWLVKRDGPAALVFGGIQSYVPGLVSVNDVSPILFASKVSRFDAAALNGPADLRGDGVTEMLRASADRRYWQGYLPLIGDMRVDGRNHSAVQFFSDRELESSNAERAVNPVRLDAHTESPKGVDLRVSVETPGFLRLAYTWLDGLRLVVDGRDATASVLKDSLSGAIILPIEAGSHSIQLLAARSATSWASDFIALCAVAYMCSAMAGSRMKKA